MTPALVLSAAAVTSLTTGALLALAGCGAAAPTTSTTTTSTDDSDGISNTTGGESESIAERLSAEAFQALLESEALRAIGLDLANVDPNGDVREGRIMASGDDKLTVESCRFPDVEFYVDRDDNVYAVAAGYRGDADVTEYQKPAMPRCARYEYGLPDGLSFAHKIEIEE